MGVLSGVLGIAAIWIALKAKPLGSFPYRWGVYVGLMALIGTIVTAPSLLPAYGPVESAIFVGLGAATCSGILLRKKFGVVALGLMYSAPIGKPLLTVAAPPGGLAGLGVVLTAFAIFALVNAIYFKHRWALLA